MRIFAALALAGTCLLPGAVAQEPEYPKDLIRLLQCGDNVGLVRDSDTGLLSITIYSKKVFDVAKDSRRLTPEQLDAAHPLVAEAKRQSAASYQKSLEQRKEELPKGKAFAPPETRVRIYSKTRLCTVVHVGEDYFITEDAETNSRFAHSSRHLSTIGWTDEVPLSVSVRYQDTAEQGD